MTTTSRTIPVVLPELGESVTEGVVVEWRVAEGDAVANGDTLLELTTDKVDVEVPAPADGIVARIIAQPGATVSVGEVLAELTTGGGASPDGGGGGNGAATPARAEGADGDGAATGDGGSAPAEGGGAPEPAPAPSYGDEEGERPAGAEPVTPADATASDGAAAADGGAPAEGGGAVAIVLPEMESVTEGVVIEWRKAVGDAVAADEIVVEVSTDKVDLEVPSPAAGTLASIAVPAGETFSVTSPLGEIATGAGAASSAPAPSAPAPAGDGAARDGAAGDGAASETGPSYAGTSTGTATGGAPLPEWPRVSPIARRMALEHGFDISRIAGTGPGGIVRRMDVVGAAASPPPAATPAPAAAASPATGPAPDGAVPLRGPAAALAGYMDESLTIPTATSFRTVAVGRLDAQRKAINADLAASGAGGKLSFTHLIAWAIIRAAERWPVMGTAFVRADGTPHKVPPAGVNLGLAVDVERKDGSRSLMVPVVRDAASGGFAAFRGAYDELVGRTRTGKIKPDELRGATITLTNPGGIGTVASVPRLMPGQGTIVATGAIGYPAGLASARPEALAELGVEKVMTMTSTYDHRVIQGAESGAFLAEVDRLLAGEDEFYEDVRESLGLPRAAAAAEAPARAATAPARVAAEPARAGAPDDELLAGIAAAMSLVKAHRSHGHLAAHLDPLGSKPAGDPSLVPENLGMTPELMARIPASLLRVKVAGDTFAAALPRLREAYCGTIAYEVEHISDHQQRLWLRAAIESGRMREQLTPERRLAALQRLIEVDAFERFLRRAYLGQKTFSIEGVDALVPVMDEVIQLAAADNVSTALIGMAHRGRLATITHVVGRPPESVIAEFEGHMAFESEASEDDMRETAGDVKYHLGAEGTYMTRAGRAIKVKLAANPSHLEQVNAVVEGEARARQTIRKGRELRHDTRSAVPITVHGDAAFSGQGVVAETLNLSGLAGYTTGGTVRIIANNQIGFTTDPQESRSTHHASDLARGFDIPVIHVNADDVDACLSAARLAYAYRQRYERDVLINLIGYRRLGHNELDEPAYTQPVMSRTIKAHAPVSKLYAQRLVEEGVVTAAKVEEMIGAAERRMSEAHAAVTSRGETGSGDDAHAGRSGGATAPIRTAVPAETLASLNEQLLTMPDNFTIHPKLKPQLERRRVALGEDGGIVWAHAEALALASLLTEGVPVRLTGQDTARGTFSQRHLTLHDMGEGETWTPRTGRTYTPMEHLLRASATFELHNSPLTEAAAVGFEYGYSTEASEALVLWEAQYGDFANGAQTMIDQFIVSGRAKWGETSRLTLLLPHGYEGNGPEHSNARIERFLQLAAEDNIRVANCSTAAQYFHLLRKQALTDKKRPLIVFTPKSLLRMKSAASHIDELTSGGFRPVLDDPRVEDRSAVRRLILCSGKVAHDLDARPERGEHAEIAVARVELLHPFPEEALRELLAGYPSLEHVTWVQEEPANMGPWDFIRWQLEAILPEGVDLGYVGRARRASPSEGYPQAHQTEQERLLAAAFGDAPAVH